MSRSESRDRHVSPQPALRAVRAGPGAHQAGHTQGLRAHRAGGADRRHRAGERGGGGGGACTAGGHWRRAAGPSSRSSSPCASLLALAGRDHAWIRRRPRSPARPRRRKGRVVSPQRASVLNQLRCRAHAGAVPGCVSRAQVHPVTRRRGSWSLTCSGTRRRRAPDGTTSRVRMRAAHWPAWPRRTVVGPGSRGACCGLGRPFTHARDPLGACSAPVVFGPWCTWTLQRDARGRDWPALATAHELLLLLLLACRGDGLPSRFAWSEGPAQSVPVSKLSLSSARAPLLLCRSTTLASRRRSSSARRGSATSAARSA